jgi:hypothetical protein
VLSSSSSFCGFDKIESPASTDRLSRYKLTPGIPSGFRERFGPRGAFWPRFIPIVLE